MSAPRFHIDAALTPGATVDLTARAAHHAATVLRLRDGAAIALFNGRGGAYPARLRLQGRQARAELLSFDPTERESPLRVTLLQAWIATDKLEWLAEKAVELGAAALHLYPAARSVVKLAPERRAKRIVHLAQIAVAACEQCGRNRIPAVAAFDSLADGLRAGGGAATFALLPDADARLPCAVDTDDLRIVIGPEGGFSDDERNLLRQAGALGARLGPRVLRTETAGVAALAALQAARGDFGR